MKLDSDQENILTQAAEVALDLRERINVGRKFDMVTGWNVTVAAEVLSWLGWLTPEGWAELRRMTDDTRANLEATAPKPKEHDHG